jgi:hypothetical protein
MPNFTLKALQHFQVTLPLVPIVAQAGQFISPTLPFTLKALQHFQATLPPALVPAMAGQFMLVLTQH